MRVACIIHVMKSAAAPVTLSYQGIILFCFLLLLSFFIPFPTSDFD